MRTYVNDALSCRLTDRFKTARASPGSGLLVVKIALRNRTAWFGFYADLLAAHAEGCKEEGHHEGLKSPVEGNPGRAPSSPLASEVRADPGGGALPPRSALASGSAGQRA